MSKITKHERQNTCGKKTGEKIGLILLYMSLFLSALALNVVMCAQNSDLYLAYQEKCGLFEGEKAENRKDVIRMNESVVRFLKGKTDRIENSSERANRHMLDVKRIFNGVKIAGAILLAHAVCLFSVFRGKSVHFHWLYCAIPVIAALFLLMAFAFIDFTDLFYAFHNLLFDNDLWLLDPEEDLLIRCLPENFFYRMGRRIALGAVSLYACLSFLTFIIINKFGRRDS